MKSELRVWNADTGDLQQVLEDRCLPIESIAFAPDGRTLVSTHQALTAGAPIKFWRVE